MNKLSNKHKCRSFTAIFLLKLKFRTRTPLFMGHPVDVGEKTRHGNRNLYVHGIESTWTPIKPITTQFGVGRNQTAQVVRKQFPLGPAAAKTIHRFTR